MRPTAPRRQGRFAPSDEGLAVGAHLVHLAVVGLGELRARRVHGIADLGVVLGALNAGAPCQQRSMAPTGWRQPPPAGRYRLQTARAKAPARRPTWASTASSGGRTQSLLCAGPS